MNSILNPGQQLLKLTALTPINIGAQWGESDLDRPTQLDVQSGLPFIPDSALKGASREYWSNITPGDSELLFGCPDGWDESISREGESKEKSGNPGKIIFGNAQLLSFPFRFLNNVRVHVVPVMTLLYLARFGFINLEGENRDILEILERNNYLLNTSQELYFISDIDLEFYQQAESNTIEKIRVRVENLIPEVKEENRIIIASNEASKILWKKTSENRSQIRLGERKVTTEGTLRTIQLIPEESVFVSVLTNLNNHVINLPFERITIGSWEGTGKGWFALDILPVSSKDLNNGNQKGITYSKIELVNIAEIIQKSFETVNEFNETNQLMDKIKSIVHNFGFYMKQYGLEAALGFELAKAKPQKEKKVSDNIFAHRWFLAQILALSPPDGNLRKKWPKLKSFIESLFEKKQISDCLRKEIQIRWNWLKKFTEIGFWART
ncbi:MAG: hypothetical protein JXB26_02265 [Candidatus Aminicenantes bacterium]|nr:hypothetical protein [Candidatus Aminicenantes bacterium]